MESYNPNSHRPRSGTTGAHRHESSSPTDLLSSAQVLAEAARSTFRHESGKVDKAKAASAADELLHAASQYGHLEEKSFGKYIEKAEDYLHQYSAPAAAASHHAATPAAAQHGSARPPPYKNSKEEEEEEQGSEGGFGDYMKLAEGFMKKQGGGAHTSGGESEEGGIGDYMKMAQGFLKKY